MQQFGGGGEISSRHQGSEIGSTPRTPNGRRPECVARTRLTSTPVGVDFAPFFGPITRPLLQRGPTRDDPDVAQTLIHGPLEAVGGAFTLGRGDHTGYDSVDGTHWTKVGTVRLTGLDPTVQGGLFVASTDSVQGIGTVPSAATAVVGNLGVRGSWRAGDWVGEQVGAESSEPGDGPAFDPGTFTQSAGTFTVTGGDIAPAGRGSLGAPVCSATSSSGPSPHCSS